MYLSIYDLSGIITRCSGDSNISPDGGRQTESGRDQIQGWPRGGPWQRYLPPKMDQIQRYTSQDENIHGI